MAQVTKESLRYVDEVLVVDDGSTDRTVEMATLAGAEVISHSSNLGIGSSLKTGYKYGLRNGFDIIVQLDADGQHDPLFISPLIDYLTRNDLDLVTGSRFLGRDVENLALIRRAGIKFFSTLTGLLASSRITDITSGFRAYRSSALKLVANIDDRHWAIGQTFLAIRLGLKYGELPIQMHNRTNGSSQFDTMTMILYPIRMSRVMIRIACQQSPRQI